MTQLRIGLWIAVSSEAQNKPDKISLIEQERVGREWAAAQPNAKIVKVFKWDGYSRSETDVLTAYEDFAKQGRYEYHELRQMWQRREFDVLWVYVHDRIARSAALYAQVMGNVIKSGARIFSHSDGWIDASNVETFMAIGGFSAAGDIRKLVKRREMGMRQRLHEGRSTTSGVPETHLRVRDPITGHEIGIVVNPSNRRLFDDAAQLILEGIGWQQIERELYQRFGHVTKLNKPFAPGRIYNHMLTPMTWGHNAINFRPDRPGVSWAKYGEWILEPGHETPPGVIIAYNVIPPLYEGEIADRLKTEIKFRMASVRGNTASKDKYWFTGLVVCDECGYYMHTYASSNRKPRLKCATHWLQSHIRSDCEQRLSLMEDHLKEWLMARVDEMIELERHTLLPQSETEHPLHRDGLDAEIQQLELEIRGMLRKQSTAKGRLHELLEMEINEADILLDIKRKRFSEIEYSAALLERELEEQKRSLELIGDKGWGWFWDHDAPFIRNNFLAIMAGQRLSARDGKIKQVVHAPKVYGKK